MVSDAKIRVLIADDQEIIRHGLELILRTQPDMDVVGLASDGGEAARLARQLQPDVVLMDIVMPDVNGIAATRQIVAELPRTRVIILTTYDADDMVFDGVRAGAMSYLLKGARSEAVLNAIRSVHRGESQLDTTIAKKVMDEFRRLSERVAQDEAVAPSDELQVEHLTPREMDVLGLLAEGKSNREIADALVLSEGTVKNHVSKIMGKLHANDRAQLLVKAARRKLVRLR
jgi:DNA-binding NarL/FixJ family response regulator